jgi:hypothetical protein
VISSRQEPKLICRDDTSNLLAGENLPPAENVPCGRQQCRRPTAISRAILRRFPRRGF